MTSIGDHKPARWSNFLKPEGGPQEAQKWRTCHQDTRVGGVLVTRLSRDRFELFISRSRSNRLLKPSSRHRPRFSSRVHDHAPSSHDHEPPVAARRLVSRAAMVSPRATGFAPDGALTAKLPAVSPGRANGSTSRVRPSAARAARIANNETHEEDDEDQGPLGSSGTTKRGPLWLKRIGKGRLK